MTDGIVDRWRIALPMIDIHTIGAGGGSIARVDDGGLLQVGPAERGRRDPARPATAAAATHPTTTDADLVLGFLDAGTFLGGELRLDRDAAAHAIDEHVVGPLGLGLEEAAAGIYERGQRDDGDGRPRRQRTARATTLATSRWSWRAAPAPCTPLRSPRSSRSRCSWCRASRRSSAPPGC